VSFASGRSNEDERVGRKKTRRVKHVRIGLTRCEDKDVFFQVTDPELGTHSSRLPGSV